MKSLAIHCADIGSVKEGNFGWARLLCDGPDPRCTTGSDIGTFADAIADDLDADHPVALGFECPLFIPVRDDPVGLTAGRNWEGNRPWSAGAGAGSLATGLTETVWILERVRRRIMRDVPLFLRWEPFRQAGIGLLVWEAFVSRDAKASTHCGDAELGVRRFSAALPNPEVQDSDRSSNVRSLIGAALLQTGWTGDLSYLRRRCLVVCVEKPPVTAACPD